MRKRIRETGEKFPGIMIESRTHTGLVRRRNEDAAAIEVTDRGLALAVCDGVGGHRGGDRASMIAADTFVETVDNSSEAGEPTSIEENLVTAILNANHAILNTAEGDPELMGMGTTLVGAVIQDGIASIVNVGDSRAYHFGSVGKLTQISKDHSLVQELVDQGELTEEEAVFHPRRNVITRVLGSRREIRPDIFTIPFQSGDILLLASDGLHGYVEDKEIATILEAAESPEQACELLVEAALQTGGMDNVTVVVALAE